MTYSIFGADICPSIQTSINPEKMLLDGCEFCYVQCTRYSSESEPGFGGYVKRLRDGGVVPGAYHFCWNGGVPEQQAMHFWTTSKGLGHDIGEAPPMVDWEFCKNLDPVQCVKFIVRMMAEVKRLWYPKSDRMPVLYTYPHYASQHRQALEEHGQELAQYPLCIASYGAAKEGWTPGDGDFPLLPDCGLWSKATLWQYAGNNGRLKGVRGACDRQVWMGTTDEYWRFLGYEPVAPREPDPNGIIRDMNSYFPERNR